jgi:hypothetical protein
MVAGRGLDQFGGYLGSAYSALVDRIKGTKKKFDFPWMI